MWSTIHRPTAIRPGDADDPMKAGTSADGPEDSPLDLTKARPVIHGPLHAAPASSMAALPGSLPVEDCSPSTSSPSTPFLPTCSNPIPSASWLALKLAASMAQKLETSTAPTTPSSECSSVPPSSTATTPTTPRMSYPREFKLIVVDYFHSNGRNKYRTCKQFQITKSMLNGWLHKIDKIRESRPGSLKSGRSGRRPQFPDIERQLHALYEEACSGGSKPGNRWLRDQARTLAADQCSGQKLQGMCQFSERWLANFKKRYGIASRDSVLPPNPSSPEAPGPSTIKKEDVDNSDSDVDPCGEDSPRSSDPSPSTPSVPTSVALSIDVPAESSSSSIATELLSRPDQLPIQSFYEKFPDLCKRRSSGLSPRTLSPGSVAEPSRRGRKVQFPAVEQRLFDRVQEKLKDGQKIPNKWLQEEARGIATELCPEILVEAARSGRCLFSEHWLHNFKKRFGLPSRLIREEIEAKGSPAECRLLRPSSPSTSSPSSPGPSAFLPLLPSSFSLPLHLQAPGLIATSANIPLGGIPSARTGEGEGGGGPPPPVLPASSLEWLLLQGGFGGAPGLWNPYF